MGTRYDFEIRTRVTVEQPAELARDVDKATDSLEDFESQAERAQSASEDLDRSGRGASGSLDTMAEAALDVTGASSQMDAGVKDLLLSLGLGAGLAGVVALAAGALQGLIAKLFDSGEEAKDLGDKSRDAANDTEAAARKMVGEWERVSQAIDSANAELERQLERGNELRCLQCEESDRQLEQELLDGDRRGGAERDRIIARGQARIDAANREAGIDEDARRAERDALNAAIRQLRGELTVKEQALAEEEEQRRELNRRAELAESALRRAEEERDKQLASPGGTGVEAQVEAEIDRQRDIIRSTREGLARRGDIPPELLAELAQLRRDLEQLVAESFAVSERQAAEREQAARNLSTLEEGIVAETGDDLESEAARQQRDADREARRREAEDKARQRREKAEAARRKREAERLERERPGAGQPGDAGLAGVLQSGAEILSGLADRGAGQSEVARRFEEALSRIVDGLSGGESAAILRALESFETDVSARRSETASFVARLTALEKRMEAERKNRRLPSR